MQHFNILKIFGIILFFLIISIIPYGFGWGFFAHQEINKLAIFTLPPEMIKFFKSNIDQITDLSVQPDKRRYTMKEEACRHYIDLDAYPDSLKFNMPISWEQALDKFHKDTLLAHGVVPWHVSFMSHVLTEAFKKKDRKTIIKISAELGHYVADANVPLHTTRNYNGQFSNQHGIHSFWESRLPELFSKEYDFFVGTAIYLADIEKEVWNHVYQAHRAVDSVLSFEKNLNDKFDADKKFAFEERNQILTKVYSQEYSEAYHHRLGTQVERQMKASVKLLGSIWYTCWVNAGQPDLNELIDLNKRPIEEKADDIKDEKECIH